MKKKLLSVVLTTALTATLFAGCGEKKEETTAVTETTESTATVESAATQESEPVATVEGEEIPTPVYYYSFDQADGTDGIQPVAQDTSATPIIQPVEKEINFIPGVKGDALYIDGVTGYKLTDVNGVGDTYSVSFWLYATRFANYMPTVQFGPDIHGDATGGQHYLNITRAEWGKDGAATFPCIWAYDQLDDALWPNWAPDNDNEHLKEWVNVTLVVDANNVSVDGRTLVANLYVNGEEYSKVDSDGNLVPISVVNGCMAQSDNFDFLLGINYWDAVFKGAMDELYIFDQALTAGQALSLYQAGDTTVAYEAPERVVVVKENPDAIEAIGNTDLQVGFWSDWTSAYEIKDGETKEVVLKNYSDGVSSWDNYVMVFANEANEAHVDPNTTSDAHKEYAAVRADAFGWTPAGDIDAAAFTYSWDNWGTWSKQVMVETDVTITVNRDGDTLHIKADNVDINGTSNLMTADVAVDMTAEDPCYFFFTCENAYVELLKVGDAIVVTEDPSAIDSLGTTACNMGFWTDWTEGYELADGTTKTVHFKNYSDGLNNWDNYVVGIANNKNEAHANPNDVADHVEYAAVRADAYGWNDNAEFAYETNWEDWAAWLAAMKAADVTLAVSRDANVIVLDATVIGADGNTYTNKTTVTSSTLKAGDPCYFFLTGEACYIDILSVE